MLFRSDSKEVKEIENKIATSQNVFDILEMDKKFRYEGVEDDLYYFKDLQYKKWDYSLPTLTPKEKQYRCFRCDVRKMNEYYLIKTFYKLWIIAEDMDMSNILFAGGAISNIINGDICGRRSDLDIFVYGLSQEEATLKLIYLLEFFSKTKDLLE